MRRGQCQLPESLRWLRRRRLARGALRVAVGDDSFHCITFQFFGGVYTDPLAFIEYSTA